MQEHRKIELSDLAAEQLRSRRQALAEELSDLGVVLRGSLVRQGRRCGKEGCRCSQGEPHGPYTYVSLPNAAGGGRLRYLPAPLVDGVRRRLETTAQVDGRLAEISAINSELLVRRELDELG